MYLRRLHTKVTPCDQYLISFVGYSIFNLKTIHDEQHTFFFAQVHDINIEPSPHQLRVSQSLAKLNVPAWYSDRPRLVHLKRNWVGNQTFQQELYWQFKMETLWQKLQVDFEILLSENEHWSYHRSSWRRKCGTQSCAVTRPTTPDNISLSSSTITLRCHMSAHSQVLLLYIFFRLSTPSQNFWQSKLLETLRKFLCFKSTHSLKVNCLGCISIRQMNFIQGVQKTLFKCFLAITL